MDRSRIGTKTGNLLLDALPHEERDDLLSSAGSRPIAVGETFLSPGDPISSVILPTARTISVIAEPREGQGVEAATIGREGLGNAYSVQGSRIAGRSLIGQVSGEAITVDVDVFSKRVSEPGAAPRPWCTATSRPCSGRSRGRPGHRGPVGIRTLRPDGGG